MTRTVTQKGREKGAYGAARPRRVHGGLFEEAL